MLSFVETDRDVFIQLSRLRFVVVCVIATGLQFINSIFSTLFTYTRELTLQASQRYNLLQGCCFGLHKIVQLYLINWHTWQFRYYDY